MIEDKVCLHRFRIPTIKKCFWELVAMSYKGKYLIRKWHMSECALVTEKHDKLVNKAKHDKFIQDNMPHFQETYYTELDLKEDTMLYYE